MDRFPHFLVSALFVFYLFSLLLSFPLLTYNFINRHSSPIFFLSILLFSVYTSFRSLLFYIKKKSPLTCLFLLMLDFCLSFITITIIITIDFVFILSYNSIFATFLYFFLFSSLYLDLLFVTNILNFSLSFPPIPLQILFTHSFSPTNFPCSQYPSFRRTPQIA